MYNQTFAHLLEMQLRTERATKRASLLSSLGPLPKPEPLRLFRRRVVALPQPVEVRQRKAHSTSNMPRKAA